MNIAKALVLSMLLGTVGLVAGYGIFGSIQGQYSNPDFFINPPQDFGDHLAYYFLDVTERRQKILLCGLAGIALALLLAAIPQSDPAQQIPKAKPDPLFTSPIPATLSSPEPLLTPEAKQSLRDALSATRRVMAVLHNLANQALTWILEKPQRKRTATLLTISVGGLIALSLTLQSIRQPAHFLYERPRPGFVTVGEGMYVRQFPSLSGAVITVLPQGTPFLVLGETVESDTVPRIGTSKWYKIRMTNAVEGWAFGKLLSFR